MAQNLKFRLVWVLLALMFIGAAIFGDQLGLPDIRWIIIATCVLILIFSAYQLFNLTKIDSGTAEMQEIAGYIQEGAQTFLKREYRTMIIFTLVLAFLLALFVEPRPWVSLSFVLGTIVSTLASWIGMSVAVRAADLIRWRPDHSKRPSDRHFNCGL